MIVVSSALAQSVMHAMANHFVGSKLLIFPGERPIDAGGDATETQIASINLQASVSGRAVRLDPAGQPLASAAGIATWGRIVAADGAWLLDADVGTEPFNIRIDDTRFYLGSSIVLQQFSLIGT